MDGGMGKGFCMGSGIIRKFILMGCEKKRLEFINVMTAINSKSIHFQIIISMTKVTSVF